MDLTETRRTNAREAMERFGGVAKTSRALGYSNASFLSQMFGPNASRPPSEKTMRRMEEAMGLARGSLDRPPGAQAPASPAQASALDTAALARVISLVGQIISEEHAQVGPDRFATLVVMAYEDSAERGGDPRESRIRQVVQLLR